MLFIHSMNAIYNRNVHRRGNRVEHTLVLYIPQMKICIKTVGNVLYIHKVHSPWPCNMCMGECTTDLNLIRRCVRLSERFPLHTLEETRFTCVTISTYNDLHCIHTSEGTTWILYYTAAAATMVSVY